MSRLSFAGALATLLALSPFAAGQDRKTSALYVPANEEAWARLPRANPALPAWSRALASPLPTTTASMLNLERIHRTQNPLDPKLRAMIRWVVADANGCDLTRRAAEADLKRAGADVALLRTFVTEKGSTEPVSAALAFARNLTLSSATIPDSDVHHLSDRYGPVAVTGMIHTIAFGNFQDRVILGLGLGNVPNDSIDVVDVPWSPPGKSTIKAPERTPTAEKDWANIKLEPFHPGWSARSAVELKKLLESQKGRKPRLPAPTAEVRAKMPADLAKRYQGIVWNDFSGAYQPELTKGWFELLGTFHSEAKLDRTFSNALFWVVTRSQDCFY